MIGLAGYEAAVLSALGLTEESVPWTRWAKAYERLSVALTEDRRNVLAKQASGHLGGDDARAVAALVFGARSFAIAQAVFAAYPPGQGGFVELGAGCGPVGLVAALLGHEVELRDVAASGLELAPNIFRAAGAATPKTSVGPSEGLAGSGFGGIALAYSLNEMMARAGADSRVVGAWLSRWLEQLAPGGRLYLFEPGTKEQSQRLQGLRDAWRAHVLAPCPQRTLPCPLQARDWCHFTWAHDPGPVTQRLAQMTRRDAASLRFSWLVLQAEPVCERGSGAARLLELRYPDKHRATGMLCSSQGAVIRLTALKRDRESYEHLVRLRPGSVVEADEAGLEAKGDGLRLSTPGALRIVSQL